MAALPPMHRDRPAARDVRAPDRLADADIPASVLAGLLDLGDRHHLPTARWLAGTGLDADHLHALTAKVSFRQAATILRRALRDFGPAPVGMAIGSRGALESFGVLGAAMASCRTVAEAAALGIELHLSSGSLMDSHLEQAGHEVILRLRERSPEPTLLPFLCEEALTSTLLFWRTFVGEHLNPKWVELDYPKPAYAATYTRFFRCPVTYRAHATGMAFETSFLDVPLPTHDPVRLGAALATARDLIDPREVRPDVVVVVENLLASEVARAPSLVEVAAELGISDRSLRRQLAASGTSFAALHDDVRRQRAVDLLEQGTPVAVVADALGFSEPREFRRAFKRWSGVAPRTLHPQL